MKIIAQWKLWAIWGFCSLICYYSLDLGWTFSFGIGLGIALLTQFINERSVNKSYEALIEDNYLVAKEHGYKVVSIGRDLGVRTYQLEKELALDAEDTVSISMYIKRAIISVHYTPVSTSDMTKDTVHLSSSENYALDANDITAVEEHAVGDRVAKPSLKY
tara:strand:+ start:190 stop:672 length:483 start_codon:yes stop_codon:yes gene_type:complete